MIRLLTAALIGLGVVVLALPVAAQVLPTVRIEVLPLDPQVPLPLTTWSRIRLWLGSRSLPIIRPEPGTKFVVQASAYASSPYQTDSSPCITAAGTRVRHGVVATNFLPMGTLLKINDEIYIVEDRMNTRYNGRYLDVWFRHTSDALEFGRRNLTIEVVGYGTPGQALERADDTAVAEAEPEAGDELVKEPSAYKRANLRFIAAMRLFTSFLTTRVNLSVNRHDVDCSVK